MAGGTVGSLVVPVSADVGGLQTGLRAAAKEVKSFGKDIRRLEGLGPAGLLGVAFGGGVGGFVAQKLDQQFGLSDKMFDGAKKGVESLTASLAGMKVEGMRGAQSLVEADAKMAEQYTQSAQMVANHEREQKANKSFAGFEKELRNEAKLAQVAHDAQPYERERLVSEEKVRQRMEAEKYSAIQQKIGMMLFRQTEEIKAQTKWEDARRAGWEKVQADRKEQEAKERRTVADLERQAFTEGMTSREKALFNLQRIDNPRELARAKDALLEIDAKKAAADVRSPLEQFRRTFVDLQELNQAKPGLFNDRDFALAAAKAFDKLPPDDLANALRQAVAPMLKGSREEFSNLQTLRRAIDAMTAEEDVQGRIERLQKQQLEQEKRAADLLEKINKVLPKIKVMKF